MKFQASGTVAADLRPGWAFRPGPGHRSRGKAALADYDESSPDVLVW